MQEGAGVRQLLEDELRRQGKRLRDQRRARARASGVGEKRRAGGVRGDVHLAASRRTDLAWGALAEIRGRRTRSPAADFHRARRRTRAEPRGRSVRRVREREAGRVIVRWVWTSSSPAARGALHRAPVPRCQPTRWDDSDLRSPAGARSPSQRIAVPGYVDGIVAAGGGSAIDTAKAASAASGSSSCPCRRRIPARSGRTSSAYATRQAHGGRWLGSTPCRHRLRAGAHP